MSTNARRWGLLAAAITSEVSASLALKAALDDPAWYALVVVGYAAAFTFLALVLRAGMALGVAYGIWGASGVALTATLGAAIFGEDFTPLMGVGIAVIIAGVLLVELGSHATREPEVDQQRTTEAGRQDADPSNTRTRRGGR